MTGAQAMGNGGIGGAREERRRRRRRRTAGRCSTMNISFSARLPGDVRGDLRESICAVKYSVDPFADFRKSILEMIRDGGVRDWEEMEELVYCYVVLNPSDLHCFIAEAFLSVCSLAR
ncbi:unnamed protein product [Musa acuminata var. zebrina]